MAGVGGVLDSNPLLPPEDDDRDMAFFFLWA